MLREGDMVRHRCWHDSKRVGRVAKVYKRIFEFTKQSLLVAEVEWPRPEGNLEHDVTFLEVVS